MATAAELASLLVSLKLNSSDFHRGLDAAERRTGSFGDAMGGMGKAVAVAGAAAAAGIAGLGVAAIKTAADYEQAMSDVKAVSGATAEEFAKLDALALQLGKDTVFSAKEAAQGMSELVKGGVATEDILNGAAEAALNLASAGGVGLADAAEIMSNAGAMFGITGERMGHVADMIAGAANASSLSVIDFKYSLASVGAVARTAGQDFESTAVAIAMLGKEGLKGSDAGTSLKTMLLNLIPASKNQVAAFRQLGLITAEGANQFVDAQGKIKGMAEVAGILQRATEDLTDAEKMNLLQTAFGTDAVRAAAIMARQGAEGFSEMAAAMGKVTATEVARTKLDNLKGSLEQLKGSWETLLITLGQQGQGPVRGAVDWLTGMLNGAIEAVQGQGFAGGLLKVMYEDVQKGDWRSIANRIGVLVGDGLAGLGEMIEPYLPDWAKAAKGSIERGDFSGLASILGVAIGDGLGDLGAWISPHLPDWVNAVKDSINKGDWSTVMNTLGDKLKEVVGSGAATLEAEAPQWTAKINEWRVGLKELDMTLTPEVRTLFEALGHDSAAAVLGALTGQMQSDGTKSEVLKAAQAAFDLWVELNKFAWNLGWEAGKAAVGGILAAIGEGLGAINAAVYERAKQDLIRQYGGGASGGPPGGVGPVIPGEAAGTANFSGGWAVVGEKGPELVRLPAGSQVIPNHMLPGLAGGANLPVDYGRTFGPSSLPLDWARMSLPMDLERTFGPILEGVVHDVENGVEDTRDALAQLVGGLRDTVTVSKAMAEALAATTQAAAEKASAPATTGERAGYAYSSVNVGGSLPIDPSRVFVNGAWQQTGGTPPGTPLSGSNLPLDWSRLGLPLDLGRVYQDNRSVEVNNPVFLSGDPVEMREFAQTLFPYLREEAERQG